MARTESPKCHHYPGFNPCYLESFAADRFGQKLGRILNKDGLSTGAGGANRPSAASPPPRKLTESIAAVRSSMIQAP